MVVTQVTGGLSLDDHPDGGDCTDSGNNQCRRWRKITEELRGLGEGEGAQRGFGVWEGGEDGGGRAEAIQAEMASSWGSIWTQSLGKTPVLEVPTRQVRCKHWLGW